MTPSWSSIVQDEGYVIIYQTWYQAPLLVIYFLISSLLDPVCIKLAGWIVTFCFLIESRYQNPNYSSQYFFPMYSQLWPRVFSQLARKVSLEEDTLDRIGNLIWTGSF